MGRRDSRPPQRRDTHAAGRNPGGPGPKGRAPGGKATSFRDAQRDTKRDTKGPSHKPRPHGAAPDKGPKAHAPRGPERGSPERGSLGRGPKKAHPDRGHQASFKPAPSKSAPFKPVSFKPAPFKKAPKPQPDRDNQRPREFEPIAPQRRDAPRREEIWIYGYHPAAAALANPQRKILRVIATAEALARLREDATVPQDIIARAHTLARHDIDKLVGEDAVHQGVAVLVRPIEHNLQDVLAGLEGRADACLVLLDQVTDPHNVGAILRSAAAFGASAVIAPDRHAPEESGVMAKSASGAFDKIPYVKTVNLVRAIEIIKESQFWLVGLDAEAPTALSAIDLTGRIALVLGAEGEGIRRLVVEACDHRAKLPISSAMESLNVSNAAAVALYEKARQVGAPKKPQKP